MLPYIKADLYRLAHKKSNWIFLGVLILFYIAMFGLLYFIHDNFVDTIVTTYAEFGNNMLLGNGFLLPVFGIQSYLAVFSNDLSSKVFTGIFSAGLSKSQFLLGKIVIFTVYYWTVMSILGIIYFGVWVILSTQATIVGGNEAILHLFLMSLGLYLGMLGYALISNIVGYDTQKNGAAILAYFVVGMGLIYQLLTGLSLVISALEPLQGWLFTEQFLNMQYTISTGMAPSVKELGIMLGYIIAALGLNWVVLNRAEIE